MNLLQYPDFSGAFQMTSYSRGYQLFGIKLFIYFFSFIGGGPPLTFKGALPHAVRYQPIQTMSLYIQTFALLGPDSRILEAGRHSCFAQ